MSASSKQADETLNVNIVDFLYAGTGRHKLIE